MKAKSIHFKKNLLAASVSSCVLASVGVQAQDGPTAVEEVQVVGMRASLVSSMNTKRDSVGVVDAITSEDIGKMPDSNLAESLQRIAGVSISRVNGEGSRVTVRGIDPSMNMVTLNGRNLPTVTADGTDGDKASRAFSFANLASEGISAIEVYKTGKAHVAGGGLGASINLKTVRPLDLGETKGSIGAKVVQDSTVYRSDVGDAYTPEISGLYSWLNDDENFGVALSASFQERDNVRSNAFVNNWQLRTVGAGDANTIDGNIPIAASVTNLPSEGGLYAIPTDLRYAIEDTHRERTNAQLTMQFRPVESVTATVDYTFSEFDLVADRSQQSTWYNQSAITGLTFDTGASVATPIIYEESYPGAGKDVSFAQQASHAHAQNNSFGVNVEWEVNDALTLSVDAHNSTARSRTERTEIGLNANVTISEYSSWVTDLPVMGVGIDDSDPTKGNDNGILDGGDVSSAMGSVAWDEQEAEIEQIRLMGEVDLGELAMFEESSMSFGIESRTDNNYTLVDNGTNPRITMGNWGGVDPDLFGAGWSDFFTPRNFGDAFPGQGAATSDSNFLSTGLDGDINPIIDRLEYIYNSGIDPSNFANFPSGKIQPSNNLAVNREIIEEVTAVYASFTGAFELSGMEANLGIGIRSEDTDLTSNAVMLIPLNQRWDGDNDWSMITGAARETFSVKNSYDNFMPNVDFDISVTEDLKLRASYSETMARPGYGSLRADIALNQYPKQATSGNPTLIAMESKNIDLSAEWYYAEDSYVSAAYFTKDVSNFVGSSVVDAQLFGLRDVREGPRFAQAQADIIAANGDPNSELEQHNQMLINEGLDPAVESTFIEPDATDPIQTWALTLPSNQNDASIDGFEFSLLHWFGDTGFGVQANYTVVDSDLEFDDTSDQEQFALIGLSDTANLMAFYENGGLQTRLTYNWRDEFLNSTVQGGNNAPGYVEEFAQIDFTVSYDVAENVTVSFEGLNITGEDYRLRGRSAYQMFNFEDLGARYQAGVRVSF